MTEAVADRSSSGLLERMVPSTIGPAAPQTVWPLGAFAIEPDGEGILLADRSQREGLSEYAARRGRADGLEGEALIDAVERSGLRGRGGAGFPTAVKLRTVAAATGRKVVVANGEEGEPLSIKDRWLLRVRPHLVLDGLLRAGHAIGADRAYVYVSDDLAMRSMAAAVTERGADLPVEVVRVARGYVAGEETSVVRAINGGPALPLDKPPRPFEKGVDELPTLVCNVEGLAHLAHIAAGFDREPTLLVTLSGAHVRPGLYECRLGTPLDELVRRAGGRPDQVDAFLMGGYFGGMLTGDHVTLQLSHEAFSAVGSGLGCGAIHLLGHDDCPVWVAGTVMAYFDAENAKQCGACFRGTASMRRVLDDLVAGTVDEAMIDKLKGWSQSLRGRGACGTLDAAANIPASLFAHFDELVEVHRNAVCVRCTTLRDQGRRAPVMDIERKMA